MSPVYIYGIVVVHFSVLNPYVADSNFEGVVDDFRFILKDLRRSEGPCLNTPKVILCHVRLDFVFVMFRDRNGLPKMTIWGFLLQRKFAGQMPFLSPNQQCSGT